MEQGTVLYGGRRGRTYRVRTANKTIILLLSAIRRTQQNKDVLLRSDAHKARMHRMRA